MRDVPQMSMELYDTRCAVDLNDEYVTVDTDTNM